MTHGSAGDPEGASPDMPAPDEPDIYGTGQGIHVGSQVVVTGQGMGTVVAACISNAFDHRDFIPVIIEGDRDPICFPRELVTLYADIYAGTVIEATDDAIREHRRPGLPLVLAEVRKALDHV